MIKINDRFSIERDSYGWTLYEYIPTERPDAKREYRKKPFYFPRLHHVVEEIIDRVPSEASSLKEMVFKIEQIRDEIYRALMHSKAD